MLGWLDVTGLLGGNKKRKNIGRPGVVALEAEAGRTEFKVSQELQNETV